MRLFGLEFRGDILRRYIKYPPSCSQPILHSLQVTPYSTTKTFNSATRTRRPLAYRPHQWTDSLAPSSQLQISTNSQNQWLFLKCIQIHKTFAHVVIDAFMSIKTWHVEKRSLASSDGADNGFVSCVSRSSRWNRSLLRIVPVRQALQ